MSAAARVEAAVWGDWRFRALASALGCDWHGAIGRCAHLWGECTRRGSYTLPEAAIGAILGADPAEAVAALVSCELAEETPDGVRIRGTEGRIEWLEAKRRAGRRGGRARAAQADRDGGQFVSAGTIAQTGTRQLPDTDQTQTRPPATTPATTPAATQRVSAVAELVTGRKRAGKTQADVAKALLVGNKQVSLWERGVEVLPEGYRQRYAEVVVAWSRPKGGAIRLREYFCDRFRAAVGADYVWQDAKDNTHAAHLVRQLGLDKAQRYVDNLFAHSANGWPESPDLGTLRAHVNKFAAPPRAQSRAHGHGAVASRAEHERDRQNGGKF